MCQGEFEIHTSGEEGTYTDKSRKIQSYICGLIILNKVSLIRSVVGLVSIPSRVFSFRLLALPAITLKYRHLLSLTMVNFSRKKHPGQCRVLFSFSFLVFFLLYMTVFEPLFCLMQTASADDFSSPVTFLPSASPAVQSSF